MWKPITEGEMRERLQEDIAALSEEDLKLFHQMSVPLRQQKCWRSVSQTLDALFVVAECGALILLFDDTEDEYAIAEKKASDRIQDWNLLGSLSFSVRALRREGLR